MMMMRRWRAGERHAKLCGTTSELAISYVSIGLSRFMYSTIGRSGRLRRSNYFCEEAAIIWAMLRSSLDEMEVEDFCWLCDR